MTTPTFTIRASTTHADIEDAIPYGEMRRHAILTIRASTTNADIESAIPCDEMRRHAIERRDDAAAVIDEMGDEAVLDLYKIDGVTVLWSSAYCYGVVNKTGRGAGDCLYAGEKPEGVVTPAEAAAFWYKQNARR